MALSKKYNIWNKNFICIFIINFVISFVFYASTIATMDFAKHVLNSSTSMAGLANGIFVIGALVARLYFGSIIDTINIKKTIIFSIILYFISNSYHLFLNSNLELISTRFFSGVFYGICSCACGTAIARLVPSNKKGIGVGYYALSTVVSAAVGPFMGIYYVSKNDFTTCFIIILATILLAFFSSLILHIRRFKKVKKIHNINSKFSIYNYVEKSVLNVAYVTFCLGFSYGALLAFISPFSKEINLIEAGKYFFVFYAAILIFSRPISGKIFDKLGANFIIIPSIIFYIISFVLLALCQNSYMLYLSAIFCALGYGNATSSLQSLSIKICPPSKMGLANSTFFIALDVGMGISPYLLGIIEPKIGYSNIYMICSMIILFSLILYYFYFSFKTKI